MLVFTVSLLCSLDLTSVILGASVLHCLQTLSQLSFRFDQVGQLCGEVFALQSKYEIKVTPTSAGATLVWECSTSDLIMEVEFLGLTWRHQDEPLQAHVEPIVGEVC